MLLLLWDNAIMPICKETAFLVKNRWDNRILKALMALNFIGNTIICHHAIKQFESVIKYKGLYNLCLDLLL